MFTCVICMLFPIQYQIIAANVSTKDYQPVKLEDGVGPVEVTFTYSVKWSPTE